MNSLKNADKRTCGSCSMCCFLFDISELRKPKNKWCQYCKPGKGCSIYNQTRPETCSVYECAWLEGWVSDFWFPAKSKMIINHQPVAGETILKITVHHQYPNKWKEEPYHSSIIEESKKFNIIITVSESIVYTNCSSELLKKWRDQHMYVAQKEQRS